MHTVAPPIMGLRVFLLPIPDLQLGPQAIQFFHQISAPITRNCYSCFSSDNHQTNSWRCLSGARSGGSRWDWEKNVNPKQRSRFTNGYATDDSDEEPDFGSRNAAKQRIWWYEFDEEVEVDDDDDGFGMLEASIGFNWVSKVFQAFGWMIPAVIISLLMGTGPNTIIMAIVVPLAQSAFSLAADTLFGRPNESPKPKAKRKKKPFGGAAGHVKVRREKQMRTERRKEAGNYKSWINANDGSTKSRAGDSQNFGEWDELDNQARVDNDPRV